MCLQKVGLPPGDYSWHSFRRGAAVFAYDLGLSDSSVQLLRDWSSAAFKNYLEFAYDKQIDIAETIASKFDLHVRDC